MMRSNRIVAVGLLTRRDLDVLGPAFDRAYPLEESACFNDLLLAIDDADRELWRARDAHRASEVAGG